MKEGLIIKLNWMMYRSVIIDKLPLLGVKDAKSLYKKAKKIYDSEMASLENYGPNDTLKLNLSHAVMLGAIYSCCENRPSLDQLARFYREMVFGLGLVRNYFMKIDMLDKRIVQKQKELSIQSQNATHKYTWQFDVETLDENRFVATFHRCGIFDYLKSKGLGHIAPAMCSMDYAFAEGGKYLFCRNQTLATGGSCCDCHYIRSSAATDKEKSNSVANKIDEAKRGGIEL